MKILAIEMKLKAKEIQKEILRIRNYKVSIKDIMTILVCKSIGDYTTIHDSKLYKQHGNVYCSILELI
jgi:hypothetical protein